MIELLNAGVRLGTRWIFRELDLHIKQGASVAILGPNGRGKTTLIRAIIGVQPLTEGTRRAPKLIGFVPQAVGTPAPYRVIEMVVMGRAKSMGIFGAPAADDYEIAYQMLETVGLKKLAARSFASLSGGERQLVLVARALATGATTILLDEPSSELDLANQSRLLSIIETLRCDPSFTVIFSTHQPQHALYAADQVIMMADGILVGEVETLMNETNLSALYGVEIKRVTLKESVDAISPVIKPHSLVTKSSQDLPVSAAEIGSENRAGRISRGQFLGISAATALAAMMPLCRHRYRTVWFPTQKTSAISFRDLDGNTVNLERPAQRIVTLVTPNAAMAVAAHGSPARLIGIHPFAHNGFANSFMGELFPDLLKISTNIVVGSNFAPNVESVTALRPDVVVHLGSLDNATTALLLEDAGLTVAQCKPLAAGAEATLAATLVMFGEMIGDVSRAHRLNEIRTESARLLAESLSGIQPGERQRALILTRSGDSLYASGGGANNPYSYSIYSACGVNVARDLPDFSPVGVEQIVAWDPDVIFLFNRTGENPRTIFADPILGAGSAARQRRIYVLPSGSHYWGSFGVEDALTQLWMAELFYPGKIASDLRGEMLKTYQAMFDRYFSGELINRILLANVNSDSANYQRFLG